MGPPGAYHKSDRKGHPRTDSRPGDSARRDRDRADGSDRMRSSQQHDRRDGPSDRDRAGYSGRRDDRWERPPGRALPPFGSRRERDVVARPEVQEPRRPLSGRGDGERGPPPPGPPGRSGGITGASPSGGGLGSSGLLSELRRMAQQKLKAAERLQSPLEEGEAVELEEGEADPVEGVGHKRHAQIVWRTPPKQARTEGAAEAEREATHAPRTATPQAPAKSLAGLSAAERAAAELEEFARASHANIDPNAPPALKSSPSVSGDDHGYRDPDDAVDFPKRPAISSRWLDADLEEDPNADEVGKAVAAAEEPPAPEEPEEAEGDGGGSPPEGEVMAGPPERHISMLDRCRAVDQFEKLNRISEGTYGVVYRARDRRTGRICALKKVRMEKEKDGFPLTSIREINILLSFHHPNIVDVSEVVVGNKLDDIFMVMEYMEHDLKALQESMSKPFAVSEVKCLMQQLFAGMAYLHDNWVLHRDLKTSNILYSNKGELKICDFGLARQFGSPLRPYTHNVVTLWYRAPELLLGTAEYSTAIDMWSLGCIMAELLTKKVLFDAQSEIEQVKKIFDLLGTPTEENWPGHKQLKNMDKYNFVLQPRNRLREKFPLPGMSHDGRNTLTAEGYALLSGLLQLDPSRRITADKALKHPWLSEQPLPKDRALMPTFPDKEAGSAAARRSRQQRLQPSPDPRVAAAGSLAARAAQIASAFTKP